MKQQALLFTLLILVFITLSGCGTQPPTSTNNTPIWTKQISGITNEVDTVIWDNTNGGRFIATSGPLNLRSLDGISWGINVSGYNPYYLNSLIWTGTKFVGVGSGSVTILTSGDSWTWTSYNPGYTVGLTNIRYINNKFIAFDRGFQILTSIDGITWTKNPGNNILDIASTGSRFVGVGNFGTIMTSPDMITWTPQISGTTQTLNKIIWSGTKLVAIGWNGTILTSTDGINWNTQNSRTTPTTLNDIIWTGTKFIIVGDGGTILTSLDGNTWTLEISGTTNSLRSVAWSGSKVVVVGWGGTILTSSNP